jgi:hypothetical protein
MATERNGNTLAAPVATTITVPAGTRIYVGWTPVTLAADAVVETTAINAEHVRLELEYQQQPLRMSKR